MSQKYKEPKDITLSEIARDVLAFWKKERIFEKSVSQREGATPFTFYEGPPSANGTPGIHHVMARTVKDIFCRYKTLQGYQVKRKGGWDTHGLPVELQVEKELGITKDDIGKRISIAEYNRKCKETVMKYKDQWDDLTEKMGYWVDLDHPYITYENKYIETLWWILKQLYAKGLLYKGYTIQPYSPSDGTGLSSHELNQPGCYKDVKDTSVVAQFKVIRDARSEFLFKGLEASDEVFILAWTTTPWTLPSNTALAINKAIKYTRVYTRNRYTEKHQFVVMAKARYEVYFNKPTRPGDKNIIQPGGKELDMYSPERELDFNGSELVGVRYEQLLPYLKPLRDTDKAFQVVAGDFVTTEDGTGIVHSSPTFGADDFRVSQQNGIPPLTLLDEAGNEVPTVDRKGKFVAEIGRKLQEGVAKYKIKTHKPLGENDFYVKNYTDEDESNPDYKTTDVILSIILKEENKAFKVEKYEHTYPHSWRTDKPVLYYPLDAWFIKTTALKDKMVALNNTINWQPESTGTGRFGNWLENLVDWNLSRSRFWGTPLPIWRTKDGKEEICIGSIPELQAELANAQKAGIPSPGLKSIHDIELHRPYVDEVVLVSPTGKPMYREPDLIDVWFDSGAMPYAQWGLDADKVARNEKFPFKPGFDGAFPADYISEGVDQTRGWFFTLHAIAALLYESVSFKNVVSTGLVLDKDGNKMSKRKGNVVDPFATLEKFGPDVVRWYMMENAPAWDNLKFDMNGLVETQRRFFGTLMNTYAFFALYANIDGFVKDEADVVPYKQLSVLDRWIISKLQTLITDVTKTYDSYDPTPAARAIQEFVNDHLSNWYVRLNRKRFWQPLTRGELSADKKAAYETLYECLLVVAQLMSPLAPFYADYLYCNLTDNIREKALRIKSPLRFESVHHTDLVKTETNRMDAKLERSMGYAQTICSLVHSIRKNSKIKVRTPLQKVLIPVLDSRFAEEVKSVEEIIRSEVNVKAVEYVDDASGMVVKKVRPNLPKLGKQYGARMKEVTAVIQSLSPAEIQSLEKSGKLTKSGFDLALDDVLIASEDIPGWSVASDGAITVALDIQVTDELKQEGIARDFVNRVQNMRKDLGLDVQDKITIDLQSSKENEQAVEAINSFKSYITQETQALALNIKDEVKGAAEVDMDDFSLYIKVAKA